MLRYLLKKIFILFALLAGITFLTFSLIKALPGDPALGLIGKHAEEEDLKRIRKELGVDRPFFVQYFGYIGLLAKGEFGRSYYTNREVMDDIVQKLPNTMKLALLAMLIATVSGVFLGFMAGIKKDSILDKTVSTLAVTGLSMPVFWSGLLLILLFSLKLRYLPPSGTGGLRFMILPAVTLALPALAVIARVTRASVIEVCELPFVKVLDAKGLRRTRINVIHILKNILIPLITIVGLDFGSYLNGAVLTETIFGWDGIGRFIMEGIIKRDYPVIMGCIVTGTFIFVSINSVVDILYHYVDPRVSVYGKSV